MKNKFTKLEKNWILYDVGNSGFVLLATVLLPIIFNGLASAELTENQYFAYWGYAITISTIVTAFLGPFLGAISDKSGKRKEMFTLTVLVGSGLCILLGFMTNWLFYLVAFVLSKIAFNTSLVFYDSMLLDVTDSENVDRVSSHGYAWGYIGSTLPFIISIILMLYYETIGISLQLATYIVFILNGIWWFALAVPLIKSYSQKHHQADENQSLLSLKDTIETLKEIKKDKKILLYLVSYFFFIDGVYTIINMATAYGTSLGLSQTGLIIALLVTQFVAFPFAILFSSLSKKYESKNLISICIGAYFLIALYGAQLDKLYEFWVLAVGVGMFQGAIQALSRSYFAKIIPSHKSGEYFGIFDICGKGASFVGTLLISVITQITGKQNLAVLSLSVMFFIGFIVFRYSLKFENKNA